MKRTIIIILGVLLLCSSVAWAVPETVSVRLLDVTPSSFCVAWMTDVAAEPTVQVFADPSGNDEITQTVRITPMPDAASTTAAAARQKGIMKVRVSGLDANTLYYVKTVTIDPGQQLSVGYSALQPVTTSDRVDAHLTNHDGSYAPLNNDLLTFPVYIRPGLSGEALGEGNLLVLEGALSSYPLSAFIGQGISTPEGLIDLNNLFDLDGASLKVFAGDKATLRIYRGGTLSTLLHYRKFAANSGLVTVFEPVRGFFEDINLDGKVDAADFALFKQQYQQTADGNLFNPDYNFIPVADGTITTEDIIDARDFARFATQFGRTDIE
ncbi:MAG: hypothetical protein IBX47_12155 [Desulfuromonadales bacterium]|nr:hypothetical protein [Desulfuromonadales bacterium]